MATDREVVDALREVLDPERAAKIDRVAASRLGGVVVVLENLHDPHNGGAALRSCEACGILEVRVVGEKLQLSERVTQGCEKWLRLERDANIEATAAALKPRGFVLCATIPGAKVQLEELDPARPTAFVMGNEHEGVSDRARALCDIEIAIPLRGFSQSVNLSVATALTVYTHTQRRRAALGQDGDLSTDELLALRARYYHKDIRGAGAIVARFAASRAK